MDSRAVPASESLLGGTELTDRNTYGKQLICRGRLDDACISLTAPVEQVNRKLRDPFDRFAAESTMLECFIRKRS